MKLFMLRLTFTLSVLLLGFLASPVDLIRTAEFIPSAEAVQTRHCPEAITLALSGLKVFSMEEIRSYERHAKYTKEMLEETSASRDRAEKHLPGGVTEIEFPLKKREKGRCTYWVESPELRHLAGSLNARRIVLYTKSGKDYLREEFQLPYQHRESETFVIESILAEYSPAGVKLIENVGTALKVTVRYPCYDHRCLSEAAIGQASQDAR